MNIGIIGFGLVGRAVGIGLCKTGNTVYAFDIKYKDNTIDQESLEIESVRDSWPIHTYKFEDLLKTDINFICLPTNQKIDGSCNTTLVEKFVNDLWANNYRGIICIKSTVEIGFTQRMIDKYKTGRICFVPETLRERFSIIDFLEEMDVLVIGTQFERIFNMVKSIHGNLPKRIIQLTPSEAETFKYLNNIYAMTLIVLANSMYELCKKLKIDYSKVKNAFVQRDHVSDFYLDCNEWLRGAAGVCLPKDCSAIETLCKKINLDHVSFFHDLIKQNNKFESTVFNNMRIH